jgi:hypothetical protein
MRRDAALLLGDWRLVIDTQIGHVSVSQVSGGMNIVRPSRQPLRDFLRMRIFFNAIPYTPSS